MIDFESIRNSTTPTLVMFGASWCQPCQLMKKKLVDVEYIFIDIDDNPELKDSENIIVIPQLYSYHNGDKRFVAGYATKPDLILDRARQALKS